MTPPSGQTKLRPPPMKRSKYAHARIHVAARMLRVAAFVPGYTVFNSLASASCLLWRPDCHGDDVCWQHSSTYRYLHHGVGAALQAAALAGYAVTYYLIRRSPGGARSAQSAPSDREANEESAHVAVGVGDTISNTNV